MATVLIIEDNPANMKLACLLLRHAGHSVLCAVDAETGLTLARSEQPDLVLMDMQLPGMDGLAATALLKRDLLTAAIPVIALTALAMKADQEKCQAAGCDGYIAKPLRYQELYAAINALLRTGGAGDSPTVPANPKVEATASVAALAALQDVADARDPRLILVAEDNEINQKLILRQLALLGFAANVAGNGRLALERWQTGHYALLLTDLQMPELNGFELATAIREQERDGLTRMPIVALTANCRSREAERCLAAGMDACLSKPLQLADLKASLETWLPAPTSAICLDGETASPLVLPVLDLGVLERAVGADASVILGFLIDFRNSAQSLVSALVAACNGGRARQCHELAHKLKSSAAAVGARALAALCTRIESAGRAGNSEILSSLMPMFEQEVDAVFAALDDLVATSSKSHPIPGN